MALDSRHPPPDSRLSAYVGLGSNLGDRAGNLLLAVRGMLDAGLVVVRLSSIYETEPVDYLDQPVFLNMVAEVRVSIFSAEQMLARLLRIEYALGRRRELPEGPRIIDLDLLLCGDEQHASEFLQLPHPRMHNRRFVLTPLAELAPELIHPTLHRSISRLLNETNDHADVRLWKSTDAERHGDAETR